MKKITLHYPEEMDEAEAVEYLKDVFNPKKHDYLAKIPGNKQMATVLQYNDNRTGYYWRNKSGFNVEIH